MSRRCAAIEDDVVVKKLEGQEDAIEFTSLRTEAPRGAISWARALPDYPLSYEVIDTAQ